MMSKNPLSPQPFADKAPKIVQIIPGGGWMAKYQGGGDDPDFVSPVVAWALVENDDEERWVEPLDSDEGGLVEFVRQTSNVEKIYHPESRDEQKPE